MDQDHASRLTSLEEAQAFGERTIEQLHEQVLTLAKRVDALTARLARAEASLAERPAQRAGADDAPDIELPPHSHMPVDRQAGRTTDPFGPARGEEPSGPAAH